MVLMVRTSIVYSLMICLMMGMASANVPQQVYVLAPPTASDIVRAMGSDALGLNLSPESLPDIFTLTASRIDEDPAKFMIVQPYESGRWMGGQAVIEYARDLSYTLVSVYDKTGRRQRIYSVTAQPKTKDAARRLAQSESGAAPAALTESSAESSPEDEAEPTVESLKEEMATAQAAAAPVSAPAEMRSAAAEKKKAADQRSPAVEKKPASARVTEGAPPAPRGARAASRGFQWDDGAGAYVKSGSRTTTRVAKAPASKTSAPKPPPKAVPAVRVEEPEPPPPAAEPPSISKQETPAAEEVEPEPAVTDLTEAEIQAELAKLKKEETSQKKSKRTGMAESASAATPRSVSRADAKAGTPAAVPLSEAEDVPAPVVESQVPSEEELLGPVVATSRVTQAPILVAPALAGDRPISRSTEPPLPRSNGAPSSRAAEQKAIPNDFVWSEDENAYVPKESLKKTAKLTADVPAASAAPVPLPAVSASPSTQDTPVEPPASGARRRRQEAEKIETSADRPAVAVPSDSWSPAATARGGSDDLTEAEIQAELARIRAKHGEKKKPAKAIEEPPYVEGPGPDTQAADAWVPKEVKPRAAVEPEVPVPSVPQVASVPKPPSPSISDLLEAAAASRQAVPGESDAWVPRDVKTPSRPTEKEIQVELARVKKLEAEQAALEAKSRAQAAPVKKDIGNPEEGVLPIHAFEKFSGGRYGRHREYERRVFWGKRAKAPIQNYDFYVDEVDRKKEIQNIYYYQKGKVPKLVAQERYADVKFLSNYDVDTAKLEKPKVTKY